MKAHDRIGCLFDEIHGITRSYARWTNAFASIHEATESVAHVIALTVFKKIHAYESAS